MSIDRAWTRRPLVSEPYFGRLLPDVWTESTVRFIGTIGLVDDNHGGFESDGDALFLTSRAHVEIVGTSEGVPEGFGPLQRRMIRVFIPYPENGERLPRKGDTIEWTADTGVTYRQTIRTVTSPENLHSHIEIESEAFD